MDAEWFKKRQKMRGITSADLGEALGRSRTTVSNIYHGRQKMSFAQAEIFADVLEVPLQEVIDKGGVGKTHGKVRSFAGYSEGDAIPWAPADDNRNLSIEKTARELGAAKPGVDIWKVESDAMMMAGFMPGDMMLVNTHAALAARRGDTVLAQVYDHNAGSAITVLRRLEPPALISACADPAKWQPYIVDGNNVSIVGKVIASWRHLG